MTTTAAATHTVNNRQLAVVAVIASVWTHMAHPADLVVERHEKLGFVTRLTLEQFYAYVRWSNCVPGAEKPDFAEYVNMRSLMATIDDGNGRQYDTWAKWWFQPANRWYPEAEAGLGLGAYGDSTCWERRNRIASA